MTVFAYITGQWTFGSGQVGQKSISIKNIIDSRSLDINYSENRINV